jgi:hypothetical protein
MKTILRVFSLLLLGWFLFLIGALVYAATKRREPVPQDPKADEVDLVATFAPLEFHSESGQFRGGTVTTMFGGGEVDLRDAVLDPEGATLHLTALFGGGNLVVPETWNVESKLIGIGGVGDGRAKVERPADAPTLRLEGTAIFGGWGVSSAPSDELHEAMTAAGSAAAKASEAMGEAQASVTKKVEEAQAKVTAAIAGAASNGEGMPQPDEGTAPA